MSRAKVGGELGKNNEWYDGGQFLPSSHTTVKGEFSTKNKKKNVKSRRENALRINKKINEVLSNWYPNHNSAQARELFTKYLKDNGVNTWNISPYGVDLERWVL